MSIRIRSLRKTDSVQAFRDFIGELIDEDTYLLINKKPTLKEEREWFNQRLKGQRTSKEIIRCAWDGKTLAGNCSARRGMWKDEDNVSIGIALRKPYRGQGLGEKLLRGVIAQVKKKLKPKNIYLTVAAENKPARRLYQKVGFKVFARFPKWSKHRGRYIDNLYMLWKK